MSPEEIGKYHKEFEIKKQSNYSPVPEFNPTYINERPHIKPVLVFYINVDNWDQNEIQHVLTNFKAMCDRDKELSKSYFIFYIPILEENTFIELLNPNLLPPGDINSIKEKYEQILTDIKNKGMS